MRSKRLLAALTLGLGLAFLWMRGLAFASHNATQPPVSGLDSRSAHEPVRRPRPVNEPSAPLQAAVRITLSPSKDNTLYENANGALSNGAGEYFFVGRTLQVTDTIRRGVIAFDIAGNVPPGSVILSATLRLNMSLSPPGAGPQPIELRRMTADWGEGISDASEPGGMGAAATPGDATWIHRFYNTTFWTLAGGDFAATASATTTVAGTGVYTWGPTAQMAADVQGWLDTPATNFGWLLLGNEATAQTARRFNTREHSDPATRPVLIVEFTPPYALFLPIVLKN